MLKRENIHYRVSGAQTTEHKERAMKVFCYVMNGVLDCHHLRAVDRLLERETPKDKTDKKHNTDCDGECYCACEFSFQLDDVRSPKSV